MWWLLSASVMQQIEQARSVGMVPTATQQAQFEAVHGLSSAESTSRIMVVAGETAQISVKGVLTKTPDWMAAFFGGGNTTYTEIISAIAEAEANPSVSEIVLAIDSPGGTVSGLFETVAAIEAAKKPVNAVVSDMAASAAFAIAATADTITATNRATTFGSIGVVQRHFIDDGIIEITSTDAPKKRPDVTTEEGVAAVREELDALHEIFVDAIAAGRGTTAKKVNAEFGQGGVFLADEALKRGMIDSIAGASALKVVKSVKQTTAAIGGNEPGADMDLQTLKAQHPAVFSAAMQEGVDKGVTQERDRAAAHLIAGEMSGDMKTALAAAKDGTEMTTALQTQYMMAAANRRDINNRADDDLEADPGTAAKAKDDAAREATVADNILAVAAASCNVEMGA